MSTYWGLRCKNCGRQSDLGAQQIGKGDFDNGDLAQQFLSKAVALYPLIQQIIKSKAADAVGFSTGRFYWDGQPLDSYFFGHDVYCQLPDFELINEYGVTQPLIPESEWHELFPIRGGI